MSQYAHPNVFVSTEWPITLVPKYPPGFQKLRNYDGSWTEWGKSTGASVE